MADLSQFFSGGGGGGLVPVFYSAPVLEAGNPIVVTPSADQAVFLQFTCQSSSLDLEVKINGGPNIVVGAETPWIMIRDLQLTSGRPEIVNGFQFGFGESISFWQPGASNLWYRYILMEKA